MQPIKTNRPKLTLPVQEQLINETNSEINRPNWRTDAGEAQDAKNEARLAAIRERSAKAKKASLVERAFNGVRSISFERACRKYVHRFTCDHVPGWALKPLANGKYPGPHYASDLEWYKNTEFIGEHWERRGDVRSTGQTYPEGRLIDQPYKMLWTTVPDHRAIKNAERARPGSLQITTVKERLPEPAPDLPKVKAPKVAKRDLPAKKVKKPKVEAIEKAPKNVKVVNAPPKKAGKSKANSKRR